MYGCIENLGVYLDIDKVAEAIKSGAITKCGSASLLGNEAQEVAQSMVEGAVCGTGSEDYCDGCPVVDDARATHAALIDGVENVILSFKMGIRAQDWSLVNRSLQELERLV